MLDPDQMSQVKAQLLGFTLYGTPAHIKHLLTAFGSEDAENNYAAMQESLSGPHIVLRCLTTVDTGAPPTLTMIVASTDNLTVQ